MRQLLAVVALVVALAACGSSAAYAQSTGQVQGTANVGSAVPTRPLAVGAKDGSGNAAFCTVDPAGNLNVTIAAVTTTSGSPSGQTPRLDANRVTLVDNGINPFTDAVTFTGEFTSNGTSEVVIAAATSGQKNYLCTLTCENTSTTTIHTVKLKDRVSGKVLWRATLAPGSSSSPGGQGWIDPGQGVYQSTTGSALVVILGDAGTTDVTYTASTITK